MKEAEFDRQVLEFLDAIRIEDDNIQDWFRAVLASKTRDNETETRAMRAELQRQSTLLADQQGRLLNLRIDGQMDDDAFSRKNTELRDRHASIVLQREALNRSSDENAELAHVVTAWPLLTPESRAQILALLPGSIAILKQS